MLSPSTPKNIFAIAGRWACGVAAAGMGLMQAINADFVRLVPSLPAWWPEPRIGAVLVGLGLLVIGAAILTGYRQRAAAMALGALLLGSFLLQRVPEILANPSAGYVWTNPAKVLALLGGTLLIGGAAKRGQLAAAILLGVFLLICGAQHFVYAGFVDTLVPAWIPPGPRFWTYFTAAALLAGGLGVFLPATRRPAGLWAGAMILLWVFLVHIPRTVAARNAFELAGVFEALALGGVSWLVAAHAPQRK
ncbi:MAG TPA: hypothetical protein VIM71_03735 [Lacunisphaera sp.]